MIDQRAYVAASTSVLEANTNSSDNLDLLSRTLFLQQLNILPNQVHSHVFVRLELDPENFLNSARIGFESKSCKGAAVGQQAFLDCLREVL